MSRWWHISPNSEILLMSVIGLITTTMEGIHLNIRENIKQIWALTFPEGLFSTGFENLIKTIMSGIIFARGATVHISLAAYLLIIYPILTEKLRIMLVVWMVIDAFRSILINVVATCTGCVLCATYPEIRPVCFEFAVVKAVELACSIYMWVNVNDFYHALRGKQRHASSNTDNTQFKMNARNDLSKKEEPDIEDSFNSYSISLSRSFLAKIKDSSLNEEVDSSSINSLLAKVTVQWFVKKAFGIENQKSIDDRKAAEMFVSMSIDEIVKLQQNMRKFLEKTDNIIQEDKVNLNDKSITNSKGESNTTISGKKPKMNNNNYLKSMQYIKPGTSSGAGCEKLKI
ncbi:uncharacterized protein isoform X3 [Rhodnius prolixus]|uniref:uncharacterized protein isoform X3 n=1 Tax=Rhodnius prolixus TaxID=13249 RepID=UPI003D18989D